MKEIDIENLYRNALKLHKEKNYGIAKKNMKKYLVSTLSMSIL